MNCQTAVVRRDAENAQVTRADRRDPVFRPNVDIYETATDCVVVVDLPGATPDGIDLQVEKGTLTLSAQIAPRQPEGTRFWLRQYEVGNYGRSFQLSDAIDPTRISADYRDGVLTVTLAKREASQSRRIAVSTNN